ncbi:MAG: Ig-like domain-containing protein [Flavipsychrobacter sp.]|nr:Ig-like domain-containing protein [Flavipsychrobacter sp.]
MPSHSRISLLFLLLCVFAGCASVGNLEGGKKDTTPPKLVGINPPDSLVNTRVTKIELRFDEYIALNDPAREIQISPLLSVPPVITSLNKKVTIRIPDSLLMENTTYRISLGASVKDIHEDNKISGLHYTFSTGSYFDSLEIGGKVIDALTGLPDSGVHIILYPATASDSAVIRSRPMYVTRTNADGSFAMKGLPGKQFRIYGLKDGNDNLIFDGGKEKISFIENLIFPGDSATAYISLRTFAEVQDTTSATNDSLEAGSGKQRRGQASAGDKKKEDTPEFSYSVAADSSDRSKRTKDITRPLEITFSRDITTLNDTRITLGTDTTNANETFTARIDSVRKNVVLVNAAWKEDAVYTIRLLKGFAADSAGMEALPSRYSFRTKREDDYSKFVIHLPGKYGGAQHILLVQSGSDTIHYQPVTDTTITLTRLQPGGYQMRIIVDENRNGSWDTGDLLLKRQPEQVIAYPAPVTLKAGWDNVVDFEVTDRKGKRAASPPKGDRDTRK